MDSLNKEIFKNDFDESNKFRPYRMVQVRNEWVIENEEGKSIVVNLTSMSMSAALRNILNDEVEALLRKIDELESK